MQEYQVLQAVFCCYFYEPLHKVLRNDASVGNTFLRFYIVLGFIFISSDIFFVFYWCHAPSMHFKKSIVNYN